MKLADLPSRVVRPLGEWSETYVQVERDPKSPVRDAVLDALRSGITSPSGIARHIKKPHYSVSQALKRLQEMGLAELVERHKGRPGRGGSSPSEWVAL